MFKGFVQAVTKTHKTQRLVDVPPRHFYDIVVDVNKYVDFVPFCSESRILRTFGNGRGFEATLGIAFPPIIDESYVSKVTLDPHDMNVEIESIESSMFDSLSCRWDISETLRSSDECDVQLQIEISSSDPLLSLSLERLVEQISVAQVMAFEKRCKDVPIDDSISLNS